MTNEEIIILTSLLSLSAKVKINDSTIETEINNLNTITQTHVEFNTLIYENIDRIIESSNISNNEIVIKIINTLTILEERRELMLGILEAKNINYNNKQSLADFIDKALLSSINSFKYYTVVVGISIFLGDSARIKSAIDKIQSLGV